MWKFFLILPMLILAVFLRKKDLMCKYFYFANAPSVRAPEGARTGLSPPKLAGNPL